jgi:hypothetical protein|tara:strand:- start:1362 stop:1922 length:561 start_codon:yes stop_codon:yes gene_type:complete
MRIGLIVIVITTFLVINTYYDGKYTKLFHINKKYIQMATYAFVGLSLYLFIKKNPEGSRGMFKHAHNIIKYMPIDKDTTDMLTPLFDFKNTTDQLSAMQTGGEKTPQMKRMLNSGGNSSKRSVSETKKKFVASQQNWKCGKCDEQLKATFQVDHKVDLRYGGSNHITNLLALCTECHAEKTMQSNL